MVEDALFPSSLPGKQAATACQLLWSHLRKEEEVERTETGGGKNEVGLREREREREKQVSSSSLPSSSVTSSVLSSPLPSLLSWHPIRWQRGGNQ